MQLSLRGCVAGKGPVGYGILSPFDCSLGEYTPRFKEQKTLSLHLIIQYRRAKSREFLDFLALSILTSDNNHLIQMNWELTIFDHIA